MRHRNWTEICEIEDLSLRERLITLDLESEEGQKLVRDFPKCFGNQQVWPVPLSAILFEEKRLMKWQSTGWVLGKLLVSHEALEGFDIPVKEYAHDEWASNEWDLPILPKNVDRKARVGEVIEIGEFEEFVVVENNDNPHVSTMWVASTDFILVDCKVEVKEAEPVEHLENVPSGEINFSETDLANFKLTKAEGNLIRFDCKMHMAESEKEKLRKMPRVAYVRLKMKAWLRISAYQQCAQKC